MIVVWFLYLFIKLIGNRLLYGFYEVKLYKLFMEKMILKKFRMDGVFLLREFSFDMKVNVFFNDI